jgi:hypothetical protein
MVSTSATSPTRCLVLTLSSWSLEK